MSSDFCKRDWSGQCLGGSEIAGQPVRIGAGGVWIGFTGDLHDAHHGQVLLAVVVENEIAEANFRQVLAGGWTANTPKGKRPALNDLYP